MAVQGDSFATFPRVRKYLTTEGTSEKSEEYSELDVGSNLDQLLPHIGISDSESVSVSKRVRHLNDLAQLIRQVGQSSMVKARLKIIIGSTRLALLSSVKEVRAGALRALRYLLQSSEVMEIMARERVDLLVARSLDATPNKDIERLQAMRFVRQVVLVCPDKLSRSLVAPLVAIILSNNEPLDNLTWAAIATLCEIALLQPELTCHCGGIKALLRSLLKSQMYRISESIILTLTELLNHPQSRQFVRSQLDMESILAPLTDIHYRYSIEDMNSNANRTDREIRVEASKMALTAMLKSWPGLLCLCSPDCSGVSSFVHMIPLVEAPIQREMLDVLYNVFQLKVPEWTDDYRVAVISVDPSQYCDEWSLEQGFVAEEAKALLSPKAMSRTNLLDCYHAVLLASFMEVGLFPALVEVVKFADKHVSVMATILTGELLHLANSILPPEFFGQSLSLPGLIATAMDFDTLAEHKAACIRASEVINCLDRVHQLKKQSVQPSSLYLKLTLEQSGYLQKKTADKVMLSLPTEMDELTFTTLIRDTQVLQLPREFVRWDWNLIYSLLQHPHLYTIPVTEDNLFSKFIRALTHFYKPSSRQFASIVYSQRHSKRYSAVGVQLVKFLSQIEQGTVTGILHGLVTEIVNQLAQVTASKITSDVFSPSSVAHKLARDYILLIGALSFHNSAILQQCKIYGPLLDICSIPGRLDLHKLLIASLDCAHDNHSRVVLSKLLTSKEKETRLYATQHMRVFLRSIMPFFISWGMEMLITQLYDTDLEVANEAVDILDEACEEEAFLEALVLQQPALLHLKKGVTLFTRFISVKRGYTLLSRLGHLKTELDEWFKKHNLHYVSVVEEQLGEVLTSYQHGCHENFTRRTDKSLVSVKSFVPVHFYGQLVQHEEGCSLLKTEGHVGKFAEVLSSEPITPEQILMTKAAVWAVGHIGTSGGGLTLLLDHDIIHQLIMMAESSPVLSIRGACFYALCLISKTQAGSDALLEEGWTCVRHSREEKWPIILEEAVENFDSPVAALSPSASQSSLPSFPHTESPSTEEPASPQTPTKPAVPVNLSQSLGSNSLKFSSMRSSRTVPRRTSLQIKGPYHLKKTPSYIVRSLRPLSFCGDHQSTQDFVRASSLEKKPIKRKISKHMSLTRSTLTGFLGVALPIDLLNLFQYEEGEYIGSRAGTVTTTLFDSDHNFLLDTLSSTHSDSGERHTRVDSTEGKAAQDQISVNQDAKSGSVSPLVRQKRVDSRTLLEQGKKCSPDGAAEEETSEDTAGSVPKPLPASLRSHTSTSSSSSLLIEDHSSEGQRRLHREFLEAVYNLCSDVSLRKNSQHFNIVCEKFPQVLQDIELYWKTMELISSFQYNLTTRRFLQSKFDRLSFEPLFVAACQPQVIKRASTYSSSATVIEEKEEKRSAAVATPAVIAEAISRRRSSTGDLNIYKNGANQPPDSDIEESTCSSETANTSSEKTQTPSDTASAEMDWEPGTKKEQKNSASASEEKSAKVTLTGLSVVADKGNRLSQLEAPSETDGNAMSVVDVCYDL